MQRRFIEEYILDKRRVRVGGKYGTGLFNIAELRKPLDNDKTSGLRRRHVRHGFADVRDHRSRLGRRTRIGYVLEALQRLRSDLFQPGAELGLEQDDERDKPYLENVGQDKTQRVHMHDVADYKYDQQKHDADRKP